jgi:hypothetical protein
MSAYTSFLLNKLSVHLVDLLSEKVTGHIALQFEGRREDVVFH